MASRSWNRVELIGNLTRDPELRFTSTGSAVCTFGLATNRSYIVDGERKEDVDFHKIVAWNKLAELCNQLLKKGSKVFISGRLQYREWEGQDKIKRRDAEIVLEDMILITPKNGAPYQEETPAEAPKTESAAQETPPSQPLETPSKTDDNAAPVPPQAEEKVEDDLPF